MRGGESSSRGRFGSGFGGTLLALALAVAPTGAQSPEIPEAMERLGPLEGSWRTERVEFLTAEGEVRRVSGASAQNEMEMGGLVMEHRGRLHEPVIETMGWYFWDPVDERLHMGSVASGGRYDEFVGGWEGDRLVMVSLPNPAYEGRVFRMTHSEITADSYLETLAFSEDGGQTWQRSHRQRMHRVDGDGEAPTAAGPVLERLDAYTGHWESDQKEGRQGEHFHFVYDMAWMDEGETIARLVITRVGPDGRTVIFEGYKGREPSGEGVYYAGASPSGRGARGRVVLEGADLVTIYDGWTADGSVVEIRDVFSPVEEGVFVSRTFLRPSPDAEWRQIGEDHWTRTGPAR